MKVTYTGISYNGYSCQITVDEPTECPSCKYSLKPTVLHHSIVRDNSSIPYLYVMYLCTHCRDAFICKFSDIESFSKTGCYSFNRLDLIAPNKFKKVEFEECINNLSANFVNIYNQSLEAEHHNLNEIAGIGYRKALEFLIKDFLIFHQNIDESKVKSTNLGTCINTMIDTPQLKTVASRATWLGNDQTHYEQKYTDKDINDLKRLIELSVHWITIICLTDEAEDIEKK